MKFQFLLIFDSSIFDRFTMSGQTGENAPPHAGPGSEAVPDGGGDGSPVNPPGDEAAEVRSHGTGWDRVFSVAVEF